MVAKNLLLINLTLIIISAFYAYVGLIPGNIKCNKWGYRRTDFDFFKLEIVCLQYPKIHEGSCPIWKDCHHWYRFYNYFPTTCSHDDDCERTCKCCYSPCYGTLTCRPAIIRPTTTTEANTKPPISIIQEATTVSSTTTTRDVEAPNSSKETDLSNELDYDNNEIPPGPHILQEASNENDIEDKTTTEDSAPQVVGAEETKSKVTTPEPSLIRPDNKDKDSVVEQGEDVGSGDDETDNNDDDDDDEDNVVGGAGSSDYID